MSLDALPFAVVVARLIHFLGFSVAIGACVAATIAFRASGAARAGIDASAASIVTLAEIPGAFVALLGGLALVVMNPNVLDPASSGAGAWLHVKLVFVMGALVLAHLRMFNLHRVVRANDADEDAAALRKKGRTFDLLTLACYAAILLIVIPRYLVFA